MSSEVRKGREFADCRQEEAEFRQIPLRTTRQVAVERSEGLHWRDSDVAPISKLKDEPISPIFGNHNADRVLFMLSIVG